MSTVRHFSDIDKCSSLLNPCILVLIFKEPLCRFPLKICLFSLKLFESLIAYLLVQLLLTEFNLTGDHPRSRRLHIMMSPIGQPIFHKTPCFLQLVPLSEPHPVFLERLSNPLHVIPCLVALVRPSRLLDLILIVQFLSWVQQMVPEYFFFGAFDISFFKGLLVN